MAAQTTRRELSKEELEQLGPIVQMAVAELRKVYEKREVAFKAEIKKDDKSKLSLDEVFPYPGQDPESTTNCGVCNLPMKSHPYAAYFVSEKHEKKIRAWLDQKLRDIAEAENLLYIVQSSPSTNMMTERERIYFLEGIRSKDGAEVAEEWQRRLVFQSEASRLIDEIQYGAKHTVPGLRLSYMKETLLLRTILQTMYKGDLTGFYTDSEKHYAAKGVYDILRMNSEFFEAQVEALTAKLEKMSERTDEDLIAYVALNQTMQRTATTATVQGPTAAKPPPGQGGAMGA